MQSQGVPKFDLRVVLDDWTPGKLRDQTAEFRSVPTIQLERLSGGVPWKSARGWTVKPRQFSDDGTHVATTLAGTWATGLLQTFAGRGSSKPGVVASPTGNQKAYANPFPAGGSPSFNVSTGHAGPSFSGEAPFDRWFVSTSTYSADTAIFLSIHVPKWLSTYGLLARVFLNGPVGVRGGVSGNGRHCVQLYADGSAELSEERHDSGGWISHGWARWAGGIPSTGELNLVIDPSPAGGVDVYQFSSLIETLVDAATLAIGGFAGAHTAGPWAHWDTSDGTIQPETGVSGRTMVEIRRDVSAKVHISGIDQPLTTAVDREMHLKGGGEDAMADYPILLTWSGFEPGSSTLTGKLQYWDADLSAWADCAAVGLPGPMEGGRYQAFQLVDDCERYRVHFTFSPGPGVLAPILTGYTLYRAGRYIVPDGVTPTVVTDRIEEVYIDDGGPDPTQSVATVVLYHDGSLADPLQLRSQIPIRIEAVVRPPEDPQGAGGDETAFLFQGRVLECVSEPTTHLFYSGQTPGSSRRCTLRCAGEGWRLNEMLTGSTIDLKRVREAGGGSGNTTVIDAVRATLGATGSTPVSGDDSMLDTPSWTMPLVFSDSEPALLETLSPVWDNLRRWVEDYLGGYWVYDPSAVPEGVSPDDHHYGMFRVKAFPTGSEDPVARIYEATPDFAALSDPEETDGPKLFQDWRSYHDVAESSEDRIAASPVIGGTLGITVVPPEFNHIIVTGVGIAGSNASALAKGTVKLFAELRNFKSAEFGAEYADAPDPDPQSADYLGRVVTAYECDPGYATQQVCDNVAKRRMQMGGQGFYRYDLDTWAMPVRDRGDARQARPRLLRFGDVVEYIPASGSSFKLIVARARLSIHQASGGALWPRMTLDLHSPLEEWDAARGAYE